VGRFLHQLLSRVARREWLWLLVPLLSAGGALAFLELADEIHEGEMDRFDAQVLTALRSPGDLSDPIGPQWLLDTVRDVTSLGSHAVLTMLVVTIGGFLVGSGKRAAAAFLVVAVGGGALLSALLKELFQRPRPEVVAHLVEVSTASFPSGHSMAAAVTYLTLGALIARVLPSQRLRAYVFAVAIVVTFLVGMSRLYLGVHWPTDVLAGWCVGASWALACWTVADWLQASGRLEGAAAGDEIQIESGRR
jgi:undecaprenyl-diphosphatase